MPSDAAAETIDAATLEIPAETALPVTKYKKEYTLLDYSSPRVSADVTYLTIPEQLHLISVLNYKYKKKIGYPTLKQILAEAIFDSPEYKFVFKYPHTAQYPFEINNKDAVRGYISNQDILFQLLELHAENDPDFTLSACGKSLISTQCQQDLYNLHHTKNLSTMPGKENKYAPIKNLGMVEKFKWNNDFKSFATSKSPLKGNRYLEWIGAYFVDMVNTTLIQDDKKNLNTQLTECLIGMMEDNLVSVFGPRETESGPTPPAQQAGTTGRKKKLRIVK